MELTKQAMMDSKSVVPGIEGYNVLVSKVEKNININPDIAIEACKALIEGLSKKCLSLLSEDYISRKQIRKDCDNHLPSLVKTAFNHVYKSSFEISIHEALYGLISKHTSSIKIKRILDTITTTSVENVFQDLSTVVTKISAIRDTRGDISHGRIYPKNEESEVPLARSIASITDGICYFMIVELKSRFIEKSQTIEKLNYGDLSVFNEWLDEQHQVLSIKVDFSRLLYDHAYEKYEEFYYSEYLVLNEELDIDSTSSLSGDETSDISSNIAEPKLNDISMNPKEDDLFWTLNRKLLLVEFCNEQHFNFDKLKNLIHKHLLTNKLPLRTDIEDVLMKKPKLADKKRITFRNLEKITIFIEHLKETN